MTVVRLVLLTVDEMVGEWAARKDLKKVGMSDCHWAGYSVAQMVATSEYQLAGRKAVRTADPRGCWLVDMMVVRMVVQKVPQLVDPKAGLTVGDLVGSLAPLTAG